MPASEVFNYSAYVLAGAAGFLVAYTGAYELTKRKKKAQRDTGFMETCLHMTMVTCGVHLVQLSSVYFTKLDKE